MHEPFSNPNLLNCVAIAKTNVALVHQRCVLCSVTRHVQVFVIDSPLCI